MVFLDLFTTAAPYPAVPSECCGLTRLPRDRPWAGGKFDDESIRRKTIGMWDRVKMTESFRSNALDLRILPKVLIAPKPMRPAMTADVRDEPRGEFRTRNPAGGAGPTAPVQRAQ